ncbi:hypothetical protein [Streptomyces sp. NBC_01794]|uniref:hypothetical protein n=1 Tax=Streptomyces sp. NBC_01794 TaxID=2975942 RepID=UPI003085FE49|nr:hypothetical protein OIE54_00765 [Streptomyces sp. NBC_01794]
MWDGIELWLRKAAGLLLMGVLMTGHAFVRERWWLPWRLVVFLAGIGAVVGCGVETWKLVRSRESAKAALDRLEAAERGEGAAPI